MLLYEQTFIKPGSDIRIVHYIDWSEKKNKTKHHKFVSYSRIGDGVWIINNSIHVNKTQYSDIIKDLVQDMYLAVPVPLKPYKIEFEDPKGDIFYAFL